MFLFVHSGAGHIQLPMRKAWCLQVYTSNTKRLWPCDLLIVMAKHSFKGNCILLNCMVLSEEMIGILGMKTSSPLAHPVSTVA
ncbi:hypothetical protein TNIN_2671 [Trichonephila inaurata madagascariensis]|uniref:Uncharacterized protein n=1 Tax=Trichonephila inaurata madagascariensis TaxID=2747483 RepID=A0A8X6IC20_9ARAC|nr:hypothetical protein TNIN_2671 [Trichonephila inaurata madagascariensis]